MNADKTMLLRVGHRIGEVGCTAACAHRIPSYQFLSVFICG
jgi:hypothetical protein